MSEERTLSYPFIRHEYDSQGIHPKTCPLANSKIKKQPHHCKMEIKFKRSDEIAKTITIKRKNLITAKRSF